jgi:hypothetical protein
VTPCDRFHPGGSGGLGMFRDDGVHGDLTDDPDGGGGVIGGGGGRGRGGEGAREEEHGIRDLKINTA